MKIWIYLNGVQQGPYTLDEIAAMNIQASTPVWYEGLPQWLPASEAPATASLFSDSGDQYVEVCVAETRLEEEQSDSAANRQTVRQQEAEDMRPPCPPTYMGWSIFATLCCCTPGGIVAIIYTALTTSNYNQGNYDKAAKMSEYAQWAIMISIALGIVLMPLSFLSF